MTKKDERYLRTILAKIREHAIAGQNGSANYAFDRLRVIQNLTELTPATKEGK